MLCKCLVKLISLWNVCDALKCDVVLSSAQRIKRIKCIVAAAFLQTSLYLCASWEKAFGLVQNLRMDLDQPISFRDVELRVRINKWSRKFGENQWRMNEWSTTKKKQVHEESRIRDEECAKKNTAKLTYRKKACDFKRIHQNFRFGYLN